jgi:hypothetical protein
MNRYKQQSDSFRRNHLATEGIALSQIQNATMGSNKLLTGFKPHLSAGSVEPESLF